MQPDVHRASTEGETPLMEFIKEYIHNRCTQQRRIRIPLSAWLEDLSCGGIDLEQYATREEELYSPGLTCWKSGTPCGLYNEFGQDRRDTTWSVERFVHGTLPRDWDVVMRADEISTLGSMPGGWVDDEADSQAVHQEGDEPLADKRDKCDQADYALDDKGVLETDTRIGNWDRIMDKQIENRTRPDKPRS